MAEAYEYEAILQQMLDQVPAGIDKREGSIIYHTLAPVAFALAQQAYMLAYMTDLLFADTAEEEWLDRVTSDFGIDREQATQAVRQINTFDSVGAPFDVPIGSKFRVEDDPLRSPKKLIPASIEQSVIRQAYKATPTAGQSCRWTTSTALPQRNSYPRR